MSAPGERKEISSWEEMRKNLQFSTWPYGDQGSSYYEKWLQYQMLGTMRGLKCSTLMTFTISVISYFCGSFYIAKEPTFQAEYLQLLKLVRQAYLRKKSGIGLNFIPKEVLQAEIGRFRSYSACKNDFFSLFSTDFALLAQ